jgi:hypothetical protein
MCRVQNWGNNDGMSPGNGKALSVATEIRTTSIGYLLHAFA